MRYDATALEHCAWARSQGMTPRQVCVSVGRYRWHSEPDWIDAMNVIAAFSNAMSFDDRRGA